MQNVISTDSFLYIAAKRTFMAEASDLPAGFTRGFLLKSGKTGKTIQVPKLSAKIDEDQDIVCWEVLLSAIGCKLVVFND